MKQIINITTILLIFIQISSCKNKATETTHEEHEEETSTVEFTTAQYKIAGVELGKIEYKNMSATIAVNGMLDVPPQNLVSVSAMLGGFIKSTEMLQGMRVKKGQIIATIQNPDFIQLQSQYLENKQRLTFLELEYKRQEELAKENVASAKTFQQTSADYNSLLITVRAQEERLKILNIDPYSLSQHNIRSTVNLYAPISGYITAVNVNIGKFVNPQDIIFEIVDTEHLHAELTVFEKDITKLKNGQKIRFILVNESNHERTGSIFMINHKISEDRTIRVHAHLDKEDPTLMPNMYLKALIEIEENQTAVLPEQAVVNNAGKDYIFVKTEEPHDHSGDHDHDHETPHEEKYTFKAIEVTKGVSQNGYTALTIPQGFETGNAQVVVKGTYALLAKMSNTEKGHAH